MKFDFDIDIDLANRDNLLQHLPHVTASVDVRGELQRHNTGVYFQNMPSDPLRGFALIDHKIAEQLGYFKVDFLNNYAYREVRSAQHLDQLVATEPDWSLLEYEEIVATLYHINKHYDTVKFYRPQSINELAMVLALIRPAKKHLNGKPFSEIEHTIWDAPSNGEYHFKRSHATSYALLIVVQLNLLCEQATLR